MATDEEVFAVRAVPLAEGKALLDREQDEREEITYEQRLSLDHANLFTRFSPEDAVALVEALQALDRVTEFHAIKVADLAPVHPDDVKAIFAKERYTPDPEEIDKIIELVREYL